MKPSERNPVGGIVVYTSNFFFARYSAAFILFVDLGVCGAQTQHKAVLGFMDFQIFHQWFIRSITKAWKHLP